MYTVDMFFYNLNLSFKASLKTRGLKHSDSGPLVVRLGSISPSFYEHFLRVQIQKGQEKDKQLFALSGSTGVKAAQTC